MDPKFFRKYADLITEAEQAPVQLDEGVMDMLKPYVQKVANAMMSKFDPETLQGLKQAYDQAGGDKDKFMANIGISKKDLAPLASGAAPMSEDWKNSSLKGKVLTVLMNVLPAVGILDLFVGGGTLGNMMGDIAGPIFWVVSAALMWGIGSYNFTDNDKKQSQQSGSGKPQQSGSGALDAVKKVAGKVGGGIKKAASYL